MTRDEVIKLAREAGVIPDSQYLYPHDHQAEALERFAALVAAAEREACAKVAEGWPWKDKDDKYQTCGNGDFWDAGTNYDQGRMDAASAIRARGEK